MRSSSFFVRVFALGLFACAPTAAFAVVDAQMMVGKGDSKIDQQGGGPADRVKEVQDVTLSVHVDPFMAIPIALGGFVTSRGFTLTDETDGEPRGKMSGLLGGPEVIGWLPIGPVSPYVKASYVLGRYLHTVDGTFKDVVGSYDVEGEARYEVRGTRGAVGLRIRPAPTFGIVAEYAQASEEVTMESLDVTTTDPDGTVERVTDASGSGVTSTTTTTFLLGLEVSI